MEKIKYKIYLWIMGWTGQLNAWACREHTKILRAKQNKDMENLIRNQENQAYLEELKHKL